MRLELKNKKFEKVGDKKPVEQIFDLVNQEAKKIKLEVPFLADGFKSEKTPMQPDGVTPIVVNVAGFDMPKIKTLKQEERIKQYTKQDLEALSFTELKVIGKRFGTTDRSKDKLIKEILKIQKK